MSERKAMLDRTHDLPVTQQCKILSLSRSSAYYKPEETSQSDLALLRRDGFAVGRKHVATLMKKMRIVALYKKPNTSRRPHAHPSRWDIESHERRI